MDSLSVTESLVGTLSCIEGIHGTVVGVSGLSGSLSVNADTTTPYTGDYTVVPKAFASQTLNTANKTLTDDILVKEVPYFENENFSKGLTVYIAKEV